MARYIQYYDQHGIELIAMDSRRPFDNRLNNQNALYEAYQEIQKQAAAYMKDPEKYIKPYQCYAAILDTDKLMGGVPATLENPLFPDTY